MDDADSSITNLITDTPTLERHAAFMNYDAPVAPDSQGRVTLSHHKQATRIAYRADLTPTQRDEGNRRIRARTDWK